MARRCRFVKVIKNTRWKIFIAKNSTSIFSVEALRTDQSFFIPWSSFQKDRDKTLQDFDERDWRKAIILTGNWPIFLIRSNRSSSPFGSGTVLLGTCDLATLGELGDSNSANSSKISNFLLIRCLDWNFRYSALFSKFLGNRSAGRRRTKLSCWFALLPRHVSFFLFLLFDWFEYLNSSIQWLEQVPFQDMSWYWLTDACGILLSIDVKVPSNIPVWFSSERICGYNYGKIVCNIFLPSQFMDLISHLSYLEDRKHQT